MLGATTMTETIDILGKMTRTQYKALVRFALSKSSSLSVVVRDYDRLNGHGKEFLRKLKPHLIREVQTNSWPGTILGDTTATVLFYRSTENMYELLITPKTLYHWQHPDYPEDLVFYMSDGRNWFCSIAHEHDAFFEPEFFTKEEILIQVPGLRLVKSNHTTFG